MYKRNHTSLTSNCKARHFLPVAASRMAADSLTLSMRRLAIIVSQPCLLEQRIINTTEQCRSFSLHFKGNVYQEMDSEQRTNIEIPRC